MWVPHKEKKLKKNKTSKSQKDLQTDSLQTEVVFFFLKNFLSFISFSDSRVSDRQNSSG